MNKKILLSIALSIALIIIISLAALLSEETSMPVFSSKDYCRSHNDCSAVLGCRGCSWDCLNKNNYKPELCDSSDPICEMALEPQNQRCGCINNKCEFSEELFNSYAEIKNKALNLVVSNYKEAANLCQQLPDQDFFECSAGLAEKIVPINTSYADEICSYTTARYYEEAIDCYSFLARKVAATNSGLAIEFCSKAFNKAYCEQNVLLEIAKNNLSFDLEICDMVDNLDYCKAIKTIISAVLLAKDQDSKGAIDYCDEIPEEIVISQVYGARYDCYKKVALAISEYDIEKAKEICDKMPAGSGIKIECQQEIKKP